MGKINLNDDRFFEPDLDTRSVARELYNEVKSLPIISPHGHVDPEILSKNKNFSNPAELLIIPDHYIFRMFYSQGISLESLGISSIDGTYIEKDPRDIWRIFCKNYFLFSGTPTKMWLSYVFKEVFGIDEHPNENNAMAIYDHIQKLLSEERFRPRSIFDKFNIETLCTTESADDQLVHHRAIKESSWQGNVITAFRPDSVMNIESKGWLNEIEKLSKVSKTTIDSYKGFISAIENRRQFFKEMGATSTDQGVETPFTQRISDRQADEIFQKAMKGESSKNDQRIFIGHMLMEMARMSADDGLVMQIHAGSLRNHNDVIFRKFGPDKGADIPLKTEYTKNLRPLLNEFGNNSDFSLIIFTLDESVYSRELAPLAGHYPSMKLGPPWWFHDSIEGMKRFRKRATETAGIYNTVGFNDDTRAFLSIPARHDLCRRVDSNFLAEQVVRHVLDMDEAVKISHDLAYNLVKKSYKL